MAVKSAIEWTDATWSPLRAQVKADAAEIAIAKGYTSLIQIASKMAGHVGQHCEHVSDGCKLCYSGTWQARCLKVNGTGLPFDRRSRDLVDPFLDEKVLEQPLKWRKPKKVFVENQSDLFGEWVTDEQLDRVFAVMAICPQHTFQVLTKRPERMRAYFKDAPFRQEMFGIFAERISGLDRFRFSTDEKTGSANDILPRWTLPLANVWLGVSVESQITADERIPLLLDTLASIRFVSYEPALELVDFTRLCLIPKKVGSGRAGIHLDALSGRYVESGVAYTGEWGIDGPAPPAASRRWLDLVIVGGESGPGAHPMDIHNARTALAQCRLAVIAFFLKQFGPRPYDSHAFEGGSEWPEGKLDAVEAFPMAEKKFAVCHVLRDRKGGDMSEWPEDLRVREFPAVRS